MRLLQSPNLTAKTRSPEGSGSSAGAAAPAPGAVFDQPSPLFLHAPPFDRIKDVDFKPGLEKGMAEQRAEIEAIANSPAPPTFENTIVGLELSGQMLDRANSIFSALTSADTNDALDKLDTEISPKLAAHHDAIYLNARLFARVEAIHHRRADLNLTPEARQLLRVTYDAFVRSGANLPEADQTRLKALNEELSSLQTAFRQKLLAATKEAALVIEDRAQLEGLGDEQIAAAAKAAEQRGLAGKWVLGLQNTTQQPPLQDLADRATRENLFAASLNRAERGGPNDTRDTIVALAQLRAEKAKRLGYPNYAAYVLEDQMAKTPQAAMAFMQQLSPPARARAMAEAADLQKVIDADGEPFPLQPWDWDRYSERVRKARYDLQADEIKPYLELDRVLRDGVFYAANLLYGLSFTERHDLPVYAPDVRVFEVHDQDGSTLGLAYFDYFRRSTKSGGAWMGNFVGQSNLLGARPVIYNVGNFARPEPGEAALISFGDVITMFHEFGHGLHGLFAAQEYPTLSGTNTARDFVEFPSQFNEHWALDEAVLKRYAVHYKTGAPMPQALVDKIKAAAGFNKGYEMSELIAAAELDMQWHTLGVDAPKPQVDDFETKALMAAGADGRDVPPRYRSSYFQHIWGGGYAAGYYAYLWTQMLADDGFDWFKRHGGLTRSNGQRFRDLILSRGGAQDYEQMFRAFYGADPEIGPMLENRGLAGTPKAGDSARTSAA